MDKLQKTNLFRLSAILYSAANNTISVKQIHRKVIEDALFCSGKKYMGLSELISYINENYALLFTDLEIDAVVKGKKANELFLTSYKDGELRISLTETRVQKLKSSCKQKNLFDYIDEFLKLFKYDSQEGKDIILRFLYGMFTSNLDGFKRLLSGGVQNIQIEETFADDEKVLINDFLNWENSDKNKAIFDLANYSLEYCMLTNSNNTEFNIQNLKHKYFYLDTNIIFRAIGLNGEALKKRTKLFLSKFRSIQENIIITHNTHKEFIDSVNYYIGELERLRRPRVHSSVVSEFVNIDSIYNFYHTWSIGRYNNSLELFKQFLMSEYETFCNQYEITKDSVIPYDEEICQDTINNYTNDILRNVPDKGPVAAGYDSRNILWVESKRNRNSSDIFDTKHFFLSSDKGLYFWDYARVSAQMPVVMRPSQWLNIVLHYVQRTEDDYKSFICFLTMKVNETSVSEEKIVSIVSGISEMTNDIEQQRNLVKSFLKSETSEGILKLSEEDLEERSRLYAESELSKKVNELQNICNEMDVKNRQSEESISQQKESIEELKQEIKSLQTDLNEKEVYIEKYNDLKNLVDSDKLKSRKIWKIVFWSFVLMISAAVGLFVFIAQDWEYNIIARFVDWLSVVCVGVRAAWADSIILFPVSAVAYGICMISDAIKADKDSLKQWRFLRKSVYKISESD